MSALSISLDAFKKKIEEAVVLVPTLCAEEKLKAVQYWNVVSERLQEIVNNSAADINALATRLDQDDHTLPQPSQPPLLPHQSQHQHNPKQQISPPQPSVLLMDSMCATADGSSSDKPELYLPMISHSNSGHHNSATISDNSIKSNTNSSNQMSQEFQQSVLTSNGVVETITADERDVIDEHLASVITSYHESETSDGVDGQKSSSHQLLIAFEKQPKESQEEFQQLTQQQIMNGRHHQSVVDTNSSATSVIQELDQNLITSQRRNVIQSTQKAIEAIEKNLQNCCQEFETKNRLQFNTNCDNTCDENAISDSNLIQVIETIDESRGESSGGVANHMFNETSFDVNSYDSSSNCEDTDQNRPKFSIDENLTDSQSSAVNVVNNNQKTNNKAKKTKRKLKIINNKTKRADKKCLVSIESADIDGKGSVECDVCNKKLVNNSALETHKWIHSKPYACGECEARFSTKGNLLVHQRRHTGEKPFACDRCPASFSTKGNLKRHIKAHSGERPWKCSQCDSRFTEKKSLKVHMRRHTGEKPYQCSVCGKSFSQTGVLQTHMALHLDERKHLCELCGKAFRQRSQLRLHVLRHEGVKRWDCCDCEAKFLTKGDLERHHRVHTGERPFVCDLCGKTFTRQQSLNEHSNRHYGLKPYACTVCSKTFAEMSACYKHIKVHKKQQSINKNMINDVSVKTTAKEMDISNCLSAKSDIKPNTMRSQINVIQSTASSATKGLIYNNPCDGQIDSNTNASIDDSVNTSSNSNNIIVGNSNDSIEYVDFGAINLLANTSTQ
ncbi:unnamed protein product [Medioppia subpectinata]|uniref:C2H2-type domain-containing protein n=1 Tax=Medioppia subpectinata TaxID=1979941 RepID=A0A7R9Q3F1_9ACAR|nr:unnamed protein product [Medioppia subpectinata]CAG2111232.1 unnamed protein product [Medioppia subpectinata]